MESTRTCFGKRTADGCRRVGRSREAHRTPDTGHVGTRWALPLPAADPPYEIFKILSATSPTFWMIAASIFTPVSAEAHLGYPTAP